MQWCSSVSRLVVNDEFIKCIHLISSDVMSNFEEIGMEKQLKMFNHMCGTIRMLKG